MRTGKSFDESPHVAKPRQSIGEGAARGSIPGPGFHARQRWIRPRRFLARYGLALLCVSLAIVLRLVLGSIVVVEAAFLIFLSATLVSAWYGGVGPGILATGLGLLLVNVFLIPPIGQISPLTQQQVVLFILFFAEGTFISVLAGQLRAAADEIQERERRIGAILDTAADAIITMSGDRGIIESVNSATERMFGYAGTEMIGRNVTLLLPTALQLPMGATRRDLPGEHAPMHTVQELQGRRKGGTIFPVDLAISAFEDRGQRMLIGILRDLSGRKALEREVLEVVRLEQQRIGQELHDTAAQELTALGLLADSLKGHLGERSHAEAQIADRMAVGLKRTLGQIRAVSRGLILVEIDAEGLMAALNELATHTEELHGIRCAFECKEPVHVADNHTATQLYCIAREAVNNALKHAQSRNIQMEMIFNNERITLRIDDDGIGLPEPPPDHGGMGLKIMRYRAGLIDASLSIAPASPSGTTVTCTLNKDARHESRAPSREGKDAG